MLNPSREKINEGTYRNGERGEKCVLCDPGSQLRQEESRSKDGEGNKWDERLKTKTSGNNSCSASVQPLNAAMRSLAMSLLLFRSCLRQKILRLNRLLSRSSGPGHGRTTFLALFIFVPVLLCILAFSFFVPRVKA